MSSTVSAAELDAYRSMVDFNQKQGMKLGMEQMPWYVGALQTMAEHPIAATTIFGATAQLGIEALQGRLAYGKSRAVKARIASSASVFEGAKIKDVGKSLITLNYEEQYGKAIKAKEALGDLYASLNNAVRHPKGMSNLTPADIQKYEQLKQELLPIMDEIDNNSIRDPRGTLKTCYERIDRLRQNPDYQKFFRESGGFKRIGAFLTGNRYRIPITPVNTKLYPVTGAIARAGATTTGTAAAGAARTGLRVLPKLLTHVKAGGIAGLVSLAVNVGANYFMGTVGFDPSEEHKGLIDDNLNQQLAAQEKRRAGKKAIAGGLACTAVSSAAGVLAGMAWGAAFGSTIPLFGTIVGAVVGAVAGNWIMAKVDHIIDNNTTSAYAAVDQQLADDNIKKIAEGGEEKQNLFYETMYVVAMSYRNNMVDDNVRKAKRNLEILANNGKEFTEKELEDWLKAVESQQAQQAQS